MSRLSMTFEDGQACYGTLDSERISAQEMDERRQQNIAYEYLCHLEEARVWIEACVVEKLPSTTELEEGLRNGVYLAKLAHFFSPEAVPLKRIYDKDQTRFQARGLHFRHTDNINAWFKAMERISFPKIFYPETTDVYDRKNMPRVVYCIHALSLFLFKLGLAPQIQDLYGKVVFTEEEISAMRRELEKYGIQMPAFSKIGGILANEMPVDEAALHAAIIAINDAIDKRISEETVRALQNPAAHLINICYDHPEEYQNMLLMVKEHKAENSRNKSIDLATYEPDVYDELLTQAEIQGNINKVNAIIVLDNINAALDKEDHSVLLQMLASPYLGLRDVREESVLWYSQQLLQERENKKQNNNENELLPLDKDEVQNAISLANEQANMARLRINAVTTINIAIESRNEEKMIASLISPSAQLPPVFDFASSLYQEEFTNIRNEKQADLSYDEILGGVKILSSIALINMAVESGDVVETFNLLSHKNSHITGIDEQNMQKYLDHLSSAKHSKQGTSCEFLLHREVQDCVNEANQKALDEHERVRAIGKINEAIKTGDHLQILDALQQPSAGLKYVESKQSAHYQVLLLEAKRSKAKLLEDGEEDAELWLEEIQEAITQANRHAMEAAKLGAAMAAINQAIDEKEPTQLLQALSNTDAALYSVTPDCASSYQIQLQMAKEAKMEKGESGSEWVEYKSREGYAYYYNAHSMEYSWQKPDGYKGNNHVLTREEVQSVVSKVTAAYDRELFYKANEPYIIKIQAVIRGFIVRSAFRELQAYWQEQVPAVTKIQAWFRGMRQRKRYQDRLKVLHANESSVIKLQSKVRMLKAKKAYQKRLEVFKDNEDSVVKIQAYFRSNRARQDYKVLVNADDPPVGVVRKFVHLLDLSDLDFSEELELQKLRGQVVQDIRHNQQLEQDLNMMDIKIGLLVKNRITLQDVVAHGRKLKHHREISSAQASHKGLKALSKERRDKLEAYQHLFYLLQTQPTYLARLIFEMPQSKTTKFMESVILSLYNYAANAREEYLLLKLMKTALEEEIKSKVDKMCDIVSGNPLVIKMIVSFNRNGRGQSSLKDLLNPLVTQVIEDKTLLINTNPIEVYKAWVNQEESKTGQALGLPYDVTVEQALSHEEVSNRIEKSVKNLTTASTNFLKTILQSMDMIPYGMRYMAKVLKNALHDKFPDEPEKDILKIVGNLLYYRYINSAIVAPDAFDIIDLSRDKSLTNEQRRNLGSIAKILQFAASNKGFGGDSAHLSSMNSYIKDCHEKFKKYFKLCCEVEEPELYFNIDQYTEATMLTKPVIYISIQEICDTHQLLMDHQDAIAPDHNDDLHELLEDLGESPSVEALIGEDLDETTKIQLAKTEISLTLNNKFKMLENDLSDMHGLFIRTKLLIINLIRCCHHGEHLTTILDSPVTDEEEDEHFCLIKRMDQLDRKAESRNAQLTRSQSLINDSRLPLAQMKEKIKHNLKRLDETKLVSQENKYQEIINAIVKDIRNQRRYRLQRKQELNRLRNTVKCLDDKTKFHEEQIDYYNQYVKVCIDNLATKRKKTNRSLNPFQQKAETKTKGSIKYSAARLHKEGIVLEIEGLPTNQFKNVLFDLATTDDPGVFDISAKFMGVNMEKVELVFQDLLQLQYEGVAVMNLFGKAKVNVNLLIFLINKKFYGK